jgi:hypothetical protein
MWELCNQLRRESLGRTNFNLMERGCKERLKVMIQ